MSYEAEHMDPAIKARWVAELRSGKFPQGRKFLMSAPKEADSTESFAACCLGVLCEIAVEDGVVDKDLKVDMIDDDEKPGAGQLVTCAVYKGGDSPVNRMSEVVLPHAVRQWAGLERADPRISVIPAELPNVDWRALDEEGIYAYPGDPESMARRQWVGLSSLNDHGATFEQIARLIEEQL